METTNMGEFEVPDAPDHEQYVAAIHGLDSTQDEFFDVAKVWVTEPFDTEQIAEMHNKTNALASAFAEVAETVVHYDQLTSEEKSQTLAAIILKTDSDRVELFTDLAPASGVCKSAISQDKLAEEIDKEMRAATTDPDVGLDEVVSHLTSSYIINFNSDIQQFTEAVETDNLIRNKDRSLLKSIGERLLRVGEISVAVAIGVATAHALNKKTSN